MAKKNYSFHELVPRSRLIKIFPDPVIGNFVKTIETQMQRFQRLYFEFI